MHHGAVAAAAAWFVSPLLQYLHVYNVCDCLCLGVSNVGVDSSSNGGDGCNDSNNSNNNWWRVVVIRAAGRLLMTLLWRPLAHPNPQVTPWPPGYTQTHPAPPNTLLYAALLLYWPLFFLLFCMACRSWVLPLGCCCCCCCCHHSWCQCHRRQQLGCAV